MAIAVMAMLASLMAMGVAAWTLVLAVEELLTMRRIESWKPCRLCDVKVYGRLKTRPDVCWRCDAEIQREIEAAIEPYTALEAKYASRN